MKSPEGFRNENSIENNAAVEGDLTRRQLFRAAGEVTAGALAFAALPESNLVEATEFKEGISYIDGIKVARKEAREGHRESGAIFVKMRGGNGAWYLPLDGTEKSISRELSPIFERFGKAMKDGQVEKIIHLHVHPLLTQANYDMGLTPALVQEMKDGKRPFPASPPSRNEKSGQFAFESDAVFIPAWNWKMDLKEYGMDSRYQFAEIAADCRGLWTYKLDESPNNLWKRRIEKMKPFWKKWEALIDKKLKGLTKEQGNEVRGKLYDNDPETVAKYIVTDEDRLMYAQRIQERQEENEREEHFVKTYWNFVQKSLEQVPPPRGPGITNTPGEFDPRAYEELIRAYEEVGFRVSFTSYKELGLEK